MPDVAIPGADNQAEAADDHTFDINTSDSYMPSGAAQENESPVQNGFAVESGGRFDAERAQQGRDMSVDREYHGSGIKEDG